MNLSSMLTAKQINCSESCALTNGVDGVILAVQSENRNLPKTTIRECP